MVTKNEKIQMTFKNEEKEMKKDFKYLKNMHTKMGGHWRGFRKQNLFSLKENFGDIN